MTIEERKNAILAKIAEMKAEGADMQEALNLDDIIAILAKYGVMLG